MRGATLRGSSMKGGHIVIFDSLAVGNKEVQLFAVRFLSNYSLAILPAVQTHVNNTSLVD